MDYMGRTVHVAYPTIRKQLEKVGCKGMQAMRRTAAAGVPDGVLRRSSSSLLRDRLLAAAARIG